MKYSVAAGGGGNVFSPSPSCQDKYSRKEQSFVCERERERRVRGDLTSRQDLVQHMYLHVCGLFSTLHLGVVSSDGEVCGAVCSLRTPDSKPTKALSQITADS